VGYPKRMLEARVGRWMGLLFVGVRHEIYEFGVGCGCVQWSGADWVVGSWSMRLS